VRHASGSAATQSKERVTATRRQETSGGLGKKRPKKISPIRPFSPFEKRVGFQIGTPQKQNSGWRRVATFVALSVTAVQNHQF
jgi:hypothetical protein